MNITKSRRGHSVLEHQHNDNYDDSRVEYIISNSAQVPSFGGSQVIIDYKENGTQVLQQWLSITVSALTGLTGGMFVPATFFYNNIQVLVNGNVVETLYPEDQFLQQQLFLTDIERTPDNVLSGLYNSTSSRTTKSASQQTYIIPLWNFVKVSSAIVLNDKHHIQLKITMNPLSMVSVGTGTAVASISQINLISKVKRLSQNVITDYHNLLYNHSKLFFKFNDVRNASYQVQSGASSSDIVLNAFNGNCSLLMFVVRPTSGLSGNGLFAFTQISSYEILNSSGKNIVGGVPINNQQALYLIGNDVCESSYLTENDGGVGTDNRANVYVYPFTNDPHSSVHYGQTHGTEKLNGTERLKITYSSALSSSAQIDVYAFMEAGVEYAYDYVKKVDTYNH